MTWRESSKHGLWVSAWSALDHIFLFSFVFYQAAVHLMTVWVLKHCSLSWCRVLTYPVPFAWMLSPTHPPFTWWGSLVLQILALAGSVHVISSLNPWSLLHSLCQRWSFYVCNFNINVCLLPLWYKLRKSRSQGFLQPLLHPQSLVHSAWCIVDTQHIFEWGSK